MKYPEMKVPSKAEYEYSEKNRQKTNITLDIQKIDKALGSTDETIIKELHSHLDNKYAAYIPNWEYNMKGFVKNRGFVYIDMDESCLRSNLSIMKAKLEGFALGLVERSTKTTYNSSKNNVSVTVNNSIENDVDISISFTFEQARQQVENMTSLTDEQTQEILEKIAEIENTVNGNETKKSKWEKIKPVLAWLADKSFDVGMTLLPLLLNIQ